MIYLKCLKQPGPYRDRYIEGGVAIWEEQAEEAVVPEEVAVAGLAVAAAGAADSAAAAGVDAAAGVEAEAVGVPFFFLPGTAP